MVSEKILEFGVDTRMGGECWDGVSVFYMWDGCGFGGTRRQTIVGEMMTPLKDMFIS